MARVYGTEDMTLDEQELEYLLTVVERDQTLGGPLVGAELFNRLSTALDSAQRKGTY